MAAAAGGDTCPDPLPSVPVSFGAWAALLLYGSSVWTGPPIDPHRLLFY